jgi:hypothetical protein
LNTTNIVTNTFDCAAPAGAGGILFAVLTQQYHDAPIIVLDDPVYKNIILPPAVNRTTLIALFGPVTASQLVRIEPSNQTITLYPGENFRVAGRILSIAAYDAYDQSMVQDRDLAIQLTHVYQVGIHLVTGATVQPITAAGVSSFNDLQFDAQPGTYNLTFSSITDVSITTQVTFIVHPICPSPLYYDRLVAQCRRCALEFLIYDRSVESCVPYLGGWHATTQNSTRFCAVCDLGKTSTIGASECARCPAQTYQPVPTAKCQSCLEEGMDGLMCDGGRARIESDWFAFSILDSTTGLPRLATAQCPEGFCAGGAIQRAWIDSIERLNNFTSTTTPIPLFTSAVTDFSQCAYPRLAAEGNLLCGRCVAGHIPWGDKCTACGSTNGGMIVLLLVLSIVLILFLLRSASLQSSAGHSVIVLYFIQTAMLEVGSANNLLAWLNIVLFSPNSTSQCIAPLNVYEQATLQIVTPIILFGELMLIGGLHYLASKKFARAPRSVDGPYLQPSDLRCRVLAVLSAFSPDLYISATLTLLLFSYTQVTVACLSYVACVDVGGVSVVFTQPSMRCVSAEYRRYLILVICAMVTYVAGFPLTVFAFLWKNYSLVLSSHTHMEAEVKATNLAVHKSNSSSAVVTSGGPSAHPAVSQFLRRYSPLFSMYSSRAWFWQVLELARRIVLVAISVSLVRRPSMKFLAYSLAHLVALLLQLYLRPFSVAFYNFAELMSHHLLILLIESLIAVLPPYSASTQAYLFAIVVPPVIIYLIAAVRMFLSTRKRQQVEQLDQHIRVQQTIEDDAAAAAVGAFDDPPRARGLASSAHEVGIEMNSIPSPSTVASSHHVDSSLGGASVAPDPPAAGHARPFTAADSDRARVLPAHAVDSSDESSESDDVHESASMAL